MRDEPKRSHVSLRLAPALKQRLDEEARRSGRSFTQEVELMLEQAFLMRDVKQAIREEIRTVACSSVFSPLGWQDDPTFSVTGLS